jgi:hypothetical protein
LPDTLEKLNIKYPCLSYKDEYKLYYITNLPTSLKELYIDNEKNDFCLLEIIKKIPFNCKVSGHYEIYNAKCGNSFFYCEVIDDTITENECTCKCKCRCNCNLFLSINGRYGYIKKNG